MCPPNPPEFDEATCATAATRTSAIATGTIARENFGTMSTPLSDSRRRDWGETLSSRNTHIELNGYGAFIFRLSNRTRGHEAVCFGIADTGAIEHRFVCAGAEQLAGNLSRGTHRGESWPCPDAETRDTEALEFSDSWDAGEREQIERPFERSDNSFDISRPADAR